MESQHASSASAFPKKGELKPIQVRCLEIASLSGDPLWSTLWPASDEAFESNKLFASFRQALIQHS